MARMNMYLDFRGARFEPNASSPEFVDVSDAIETLALNRNEDLRVPNGLAICIEDSNVEFELEPIRSGPLRRRRTVKTSRLYLDDFDLRFVDDNDRYDWIRSDEFRRRSLDRIDRRRKSRSEWLYHFASVLT